MVPEIVFEDNHMLCLNKPAGWLVQADRTQDETLTDWGKSYLKQKYDKPGAVFLHPAHRIDRPVSGAVLFARTSKSLTRLTGLFRDKEVYKTYLAIVSRAPLAESGRLTHFLIKDEQRNVVEVFESPRAQAREAILDYRLLGEAASGFLLQVHPLTGRPHQIRAQLRQIGCPILGDLKYGAPEPLPDASIALHCFRMALVHPVRKVPIELCAAWPDKPWWAGVSALAE